MEGSMPDKQAIEELALRIAGAMGQSRWDEGDPDREEIARRYAELSKRHPFDIAATLARSSWIAERITEFIGFQP
jgi:ssDNA-specific exonuclease RecJ